MNKTLQIIGRRWFDKNYGNTYHTAEVRQGDVTLAKSKITYGYGEQCLQTGLDMLKELKLVPPSKRNLNGISCVITDVSKEEDL